MATLKDIAAATGLSISVVSRVLNPKPDRHARVADATRERVEEAARALGFRRNIAAEFLKRGRTPAIGLIVPAIANRLVADLIFGVTEVANEQDFPITSWYGATPDQYLRFLSTAEEQAHSGLITYANFRVDEVVAARLQRFRAGGGQVLVLNSADDLGDIPVVNFDDALAGQLAADHLHARGCRRFLADSRYGSRTAGFVARLAEDGIAVATDMPDAIVDRIQADVVGQWPVGVFATSDLHALRIMSDCRAAGLAVGEDVLLIGCDDLFGMDQLSPPLTTIHLPFRDQGRLAARKILAAIYGTPQTSETLAPHLIVRSSA